MIGIGDLCHLFLDRVQTFASLINSALAVCHNDILKSHGNQKLNNRNTSSTCTGSNDLNVFNLLSNYFQCIDHTGKSDNGCSMLIIMEDRDIAAFFQLFLNFKASWCGNVLQIHTAEASCQQADGLHDLIYILAAHAKRNGIYITELFKQNAFSFHNRHASLRTDIAKSQNCSTVCHNCNSIPASGKLIAFINIFLNLKARLGNTRGVGKA